ncbi:VWA domain-containing protein [Actinomadura graeca]|uniref:VWA domain-containing protein n=1 Tax=Actinomadura graeca TaxID=2750812 RepID=A0ABX8QXF8_9ACTN|nr:VIT domain-containing protein [Actinomadura graeca]QXJ23475.1 VWA domain-containing protein [Actinomadura graeca]
MTVRILPLPETATPPAPDRGLGTLTTDKGNLPLDSVDVHASITGLVAGVEVVQGFRNPFDVPLEATYIFPLPDRAAVTALRMEAADRVIEGTLEERGQAREDYDTAIAAGKRAAIAEEDRPDVFAMRVGNILPDERVTIRIALSQPLPCETDESGSTATFRFPLVVAPRYIPGTPLEGERAGAGAADDTDAVPDASRISPPVLLPGFPNPVRLSITTVIDPAGLPLTEIRSALHVVKEEDDGDRTTLRVQPGERLNRDFILRLGYAGHESASLSLVADGSGDEGTFTLTVLPSGESRPAPRDVVLILDRSGSMQGWKMVAARRAAARIVDTLRNEDRFAVLSFDTVIERPRDLASGLADGTDRNRFHAVEHLATLNARGGTEMLAPLDEGCALLADSTRDRVLVLITDGQIGNEDQILARLEPRLQGVRVHTVGIDRAVNAGFLNRLAAMGQGISRLVESEDRLDEAMELIHRHIGSPLATDLTLHPTGLEIIPDSVTPRRPGTLFPGVPLVIAGRFRGAPSGAVSVRGTAADGTAWEQHANGTIGDDPAAVSIWARAHLRELEDHYAVGGPDDLERRIVDTSLTFGVLCRFTAFVAVDSRVATESGTLHQAVQPVELPDGWAAPHAPRVAHAAFMAPMDAVVPPPAMGYGAAPVPSGPPPAAPSMPGSHPRRGSARTTASVHRTPPQTYPTPPTPAPAPAEPEGKPRKATGTGARGGDTPESLKRARAPFMDELSAELKRLRSVPDDHDQRIAHLLTELLPLLDSLVERMEARRLDTTPLTALRDELRLLDTTSDQARVQGVWSQALQVLSTLTKEPRRPFWKRSR